MSSRSVPRRAAGRALWRGEFIAPWDWQRGKPFAAAACAARTGACRIKGNLSRSGNRICYVPGAQHYRSHQNQYLERRAMVLLGVAGARGGVEEGEAVNA